jgi:hypothetical protein
VNDNIIYQDNESVILLEKNGQRRSSTKRTHHLEIRYFFVTDNVKSPTGHMVADFFTKPLQGSAYKKMLKMIMNLSDNDMIDPSPQECVGNNGAADKKMIRQSKFVPMTPNGRLSCRRVANRTV